MANGKIAVMVQILRNIELLVIESLSDRLTDLTAISGVLTPT